MQASCVCVCARALFLYLAAQYRGDIDTRVGAFRRIRSVIAQLPYDNNRARRPLRTERPLSLTGRC